MVAYFSSRRWGNFADYTEYVVYSRFQAPFFESIMQKDDLPLSFGNEQLHSFLDPVGDWIGGPSSLVSESSRRKAVNEVPLESGASLPLGADCEKNSQSPAIPSDFDPIEDLEASYAKVSFTMRSAPGGRGILKLSIPAESAPPFPEFPRKVEPILEERMLKGENEEERKEEEPGVISFERAKDAKVRIDAAHREKSEFLKMREDELDGRENQLNARIAQFETLVRNTKISLQEKMEELSLREQEISEEETNLRTQKATQEEKLRLDRNSLEHERLELVARKTEIEDRLNRREKELTEIATHREKELHTSLEHYRNELEKQLEGHLAEYQRRYLQKCEENQAACESKILEQQEMIERREEKLSQDVEALVARHEKQLQVKKDELQRNFEKRQEEWELQFNIRRKDLEESMLRRSQEADAELKTRREEFEARCSRRENQIQQREQIIREAEEEWNHRRESFESQWAEYEKLRQDKLRHFSEQDARLEERQRFLGDLENRFKTRENELQARDDSLKVREKQVAMDAEKYRRLQEVEEEVLQSQIESTRIREGLVRERHQLQKMAESERARLKESHELATKRLDEERIELAGQNRKIEQLRITLERSREELGRMHRETLEIRLATEELWLRMAGEAAPEDLKESLDRIRAKLAEQYRDAVGKIELQKEELKELRQQMLAQHEKLLQRREELNQWAVKSEEALHEKEEQLRLREEELDRQQSTVYEMIRRYRAERGNH